MDHNHDGGLPERAEHAQRVLEECSADRLGAMLRFSDEEKAARARLGPKRDPHDLIAEGLWRLHVPEAVDWGWGYDVSQYHASKYRKLAKANTRESIGDALMEQPKA